MEWGLIFVAAGIAIAGYFIGDGLKNFKNPNTKNLLDSLEDDDEHELIKEGCFRIKCCSFDQTLDRC